MHHGQELCQEQELLLPRDLDLDLELLEPQAPRLTRPHHLTIPCNTDGQRPLTLLMDMDSVLESLLPA